MEIFLKVDLTPRLQRFLQASAIFCPTIISKCFCIIFKEMEPRRPQRLCLEFHLFLTGHFELAPDAFGPGKHCATEKTHSAEGDKL
jgi:hypothetical protein